MNKVLLFAIVYSIVAVIIVIITLKLQKDKRLKEYKKSYEDLDRQKNELESAPVISELAKLETIVKTEKMEKKYKEWYEEFERIRKEDIPKIDDMIIDLDSYLESKSYKDYNLGVAKTEIEIYKVKSKIDNLLNEIKDINLSSEKYRNIIIKLKAKYRDLENTFRSKEEEYGEINNVISLQLENIERRVITKKYSILLKQ